MDLEEFVAVIWRRRVVFAVVLVLCVASVVIITLALPRMYEATATLYVGGGESDKAENFDANLGQQLTRTYATLASGPTVADQVLGRLDGVRSRDELHDRTTVSPVEETRLLQITAESSSPTAARRIAN